MLAFEEALVTVMSSAVVINSAIKGAVMSGDLILASYVERFSNAYSLESKPPEIQFEYFVNNCVLTRDYPGSVDLDDVSAGSSFGIDGAAIFVNDVLVSSVEEVDGITRHSVDARFVMTQAKTSSGLDIGELLKFLSAVESAFISDRVPEPLSDWADVKRHVYKQAFKFDRNPRLEIYYCYTGQYTKNMLFEEKIQESVGRLKKSNYFSDVSALILDAEALKRDFRALSNKISRTIDFRKHTSLPKIHGVKRAYLGILPCTEYMKLLTDDQGKLVRRLFNDNVRDYQGENPVNREMVGTLVNEPSGRERFGLMNNGVTIVARSINPVGDEFTIRDYQVVNGCQTSHILYNNRSVLDGSEFVTVKLIETEDAELANRITKATNRQTHVNLEAFAGLQPFHKELESYYEAIESKSRLYYERRPGQYDWDSVPERNRIVSVPQQIKSFVSVMIEEPHKIHFYYGQLLEEYNQGRSALFIEGHDPSPYYLSAWIVYLNSFRFRPDRKVWRYHVALAVRALAGGRFNHEKVFDRGYCKKYCEGVLDKLSDPVRLKSYVEQANKLLADVLRKNKYSGRDAPQQAVITEKLLAACYGGSPQLPKNAGDTGARCVGAIEMVSFEQDIGFISFGPSKIFFSPSKFQGAIALCAPEARVAFRLRQHKGETEAFDVKPNA